MDVLIKLEEKNDGINIKEKLYSVFCRLLPGIIALLASRAQLAGGAVTPFGSAYVASCTRRDMPAALIGAVIGLMLPGERGDRLRMVATVLAVGGIRWALAELRSVSAHPAFTPLAAFSGTMLTGIVVAGSLGVMLGPELVLYTAEAALSAAAAYFFSRAPGSRELERRERLSPRSLYSAALLVSVSSVPLCMITVFGFSPAEAVLLVIVIAVAHRRDALMGCAAGLCAGGVISAANGDWRYCGLCAAAGFLTGLARVRGGILPASVFSVICSATSLMSGWINVFFIAETLCASVAYTLLKPRFVERVLNAAAPDRSPKGIARSEAGGIAARLRGAAGALTGVSDTIEEVAGRLDGCGETPEQVCRAAAKRICAGCGISGHCWQSAAAETAAEFDAAAKLLSEYGQLDRHNAPELIAKRCARSGEMMELVNSMYSEHIARRSASRRIAQMRNVVADQLGGVGQLLGAMAKEVEGMEQPDLELCGRISSAFEKAGYHADNIKCVREREGGLTVRVLLHKNSPRAVPRSRLADVLTERIGVPFGELSCERGEEGFELTVRRLPAYRVRCFSAQKVREGESMCGDSYDMFEIRSGSYLVLSDGMGTGGRAAVDSAMTCALMTKLLRAGFEPESALRLVNASLLVKSEDESLSTLDCLFINVYNARAKLIKAGAARSFLVRDDRVRTLDEKSLPLGILRSTDCSVTELRLRDGDIIVMASDGADDGGELLPGIISGYGRRDASGMARFVLDNVALSGKGEDDMTVLCAVVEAIN